MEPADLRQFLGHTAPFSYLDEQGFNTLLKGLTVFYCPAEDTLEIPPDQLLIVRSGTFSQIGRASCRERV